MQGILRAPRWKGERRWKGGGTFFFFLMGGVSGGAGDRFFLFDKDPFFFFCGFWEVRSVDKKACIEVHCGSGS